MTPGMCILRVERSRGSIFPCLFAPGQGPGGKPAALCHRLGIAQDALWTQKPLYIFYHIRRRRGMLQARKSERAGSVSDGCFAVAYASGSFGFVRLIAFTV